MNQLEQLKKFTIVVADTGDFDTLRAYNPTDSTTNPSLIYAASQHPHYKKLIEDAKKEKEMTHRLDRVFVNFGLEILKLIPGRVSTEVDARLSFDVKGSLAKAEHLIALYEQAGIQRNRVLIKLASTWEGVLAAEELEKRGIHCNMTLLFCLPQAVACAKAKATLISPFVGRILDWYKKETGKTSYPPAQDPGVVSVQTIYRYYKSMGYSTQIMGASFRNREEILELAGCDLLTISPALLESLKNETAPIVRKLDPLEAKKAVVTPLGTLDEKTFRFLLNEDPMATDKLAEGIRNFSHDMAHLEAFLRDP